VPYLPGEFGFGPYGRSRPLETERPRQDPLKKTKWISEPRIIFALRRNTPGSFGKPAGASNLVVNENCTIADQEFINSAAFLKTLAERSAWRSA
jgi:hypothetical protein